MAHLPQGKFLIENVPFDSPSALWLKGVVQQSILNGDGFDWNPVKIERITNRNLERHYDVKRAEVSRFPGADMEERYGFAAEMDSFRLDMILADGLQTGMINVNTLGFAEYGVYVCNHLDVALRYSTLKAHEVETVYVVVFKYILARNTKCVPKSAVSFERIDPTIGYDSHNSIIPPKANDPITTQFERSQIYLYELNSQDIPMPRPRHCLPIAVVTFTRSGKTSRPSLTETTNQQTVDGQAKSTETDDRFAGNPALKAIVDRINSKAGSPMGPIVRSCGGALPPGLPPPGFPPGPPLGPSSLGGPGSSLQARNHRSMIPQAPGSGHQASHLGHQAKLPEQDADYDARFANNPKLRELIDKINSRSPWTGATGQLATTRHDMMRYSPNSPSHPGMGGDGYHPSLDAWMSTSLGHDWGGVKDSHQGTNGRYLSTEDFYAAERRANQSRSPRGRLH